MHHFQGYLRSFATEGSQLVIRLFAGTLDLEPEDQPVYIVAIDDPQSLNEAIDGLKQLEREDAWLYLTQPDQTTLNIESENGTEFLLRARHIKGQAHPYGPDEWEWLARANQTRANGMHESLVSALNRLNRAIELVAEQQSRIAVKSQGHPPGTTARTLYEQHAEFLARLRAAAEAYPLLKLTRYGMRCRPGVCQFHHRHAPGLQRMPPRAA
jgi:hypothetical protein